MRQVIDTFGEAPLKRFLVAVAALFLAMTSLMAADLAFDAQVGASHGHFLVDVLISALGIGGALVLTMRLVTTHHGARQLRDRLQVAEGEAQRFREEARAHLRGLAEAIDRQLLRWALSPAEREVVLLLLKGLSLKEIAAVRTCGERTVRHQARAAYRKAGLAGRVELAAFFLEDLLVPAAPRGGSEGAPPSLTEPSGAPSPAGT